MLFDFQIEIENHPFFLTFDFFTFLFRRCGKCNIQLKINFFQKISIFNFPVFISLLPIENISKH